MSDLIDDARPSSAGAAALVAGLVRFATPRRFPNGLVGLEYGRLLKAPPLPATYLAAHVAEAAAHLRACCADILVVPARSGVPIGDLYARAAGIPMIVWDKTAAMADVSGDGLGAFLLPSFTGAGRVRLTPGPAMTATVDGILASQLAAQQNVAIPNLRVRLAGADDIIDTGAMSRALTAAAPVAVQAAVSQHIRRHRQDTGDRRPMAVTVTMAAWATPMMRGDRCPPDLFGSHLRPFVGVRVTGVTLDPPAFSVGAHR